MEVYIRNTSRKLLLAVCVVILCWMAGCASPHYPDFPSLPPNEHQSYTETNNISVAARALTDPREIKKYFGTDILEDGILPVHIVVSNNSQKESYILLKENVGLLESAGISSNDRLQVGHNAENLSNIGQVLTSTVLYSYGDTQAIGQRENFALKEFQQESIEPGKQASGFVYFRRPNININILTIRLVLLQPLTGQKVTVDLKLQGD